MSAAVDRCADAFFAASAADDWDAARAVTDPDMIVWQAGGPERRFADVIGYLQRMRAKLGWWEYLDVRRIVSEEGFCEQHTVRFHAPDGGVSDVPACVVGRVGPTGRLTRLDEYVVLP